MNQSLGDIMRDKRFLFKFDNCTLDKSHFNHQGHLRVAWLNLSNYDFDHAMIRITEGIFRYAKSLEAEHIYHETLTRVWVHLVYIMPCPSSKLIISMNLSQKMNIY